MKKRVFLFNILTIICSLLTFTPLEAQNFDAGNNLFSNAIFRLSADFFNQSSGPATVDYLSDEQNHLFYSSPFFGLEMDYPLRKTVFLNTAITYSGSKTNRNEGLVFVIAPPDDALTNFNRTYRFRSFAFEPKIKTVFELSGVNFFWSIGPIFSLATLKSDIDAAPFGSPQNFSDYKDKRSRSFGLGAQVSTGIQYFLTRQVGLSVEIGYKHLTHNSLSTSIEPVDGQKSLDYQLRSFFHRVGLMFKF